MSEDIKTDEVIAEGVAQSWKSGAKSVKSGSVELIRGADGVHTVKKDGKVVGEFTVDDDHPRGDYVVSVTGSKGQKMASTVDDVVKIFESEDISTKSVVKSIIAEAKCKKEEVCDDEPGEDDDEELDVSDDDMEDDEEEVKKESVETSEESVDGLAEAMMKIDRTDDIEFTDAAEKFASEYKKMSKGNSEAFYKKYTAKITKSGLGAGGATTVYTDKTTGDAYVVNSEPNGKGFHGKTFHIKSLKESVETSEELSISEDVAAMFEGEDLSEEFKKKAAMIFEAAVAVRVNSEIDAITEELRAEFATETEKMRAELTEAVDNYTSYAATKWIEDNKIAVQKNLKSELVEDFVHGLKSLFAEHYIDLPDEAVDVVEEMTKKVASLEEQLSDAIKTNGLLTEEVNSKKKVVVLEDSITELSENQKEKIRGLVESVQFVDEEDFKEKVATLVASYFPKKEPVVTEDVTLPQETLTEEIDPAVAAYAKALSRLK